MCSECKFWGTIVAAVEPATRPAATAAYDIADTEVLLVRAFGQIPTDTVTASAVKSKMLALNPSFDQANYAAAPSGISSPASATGSPPSAGPDRTSSSP